MILKDKSIIFIQTGPTSCPNTIDNPFKAIDALEYKMMYDAVKCCNNVHRINILDDNHTHANLGFVYNKFYFGLIQNLNKYTDWYKPTTYSNITEEASLNGQIKDHKKI